MAVGVLLNRDDDSKKFTEWKGNTSGSANVNLTESNFGGTTDSAVPSKAVLVGASDGTNLEAWRNNTEGTLLASAARTATTSSATQTNYNARGVMVFLRITAASGTGGLTVSIRGRNPADGTFASLNSTPSAITTTGQLVYVVYPGVTAGGVAQATQGAVPRQWEVQVSHGDSSSYTYSVGYALIV